MDIHSTFAKKVPLCFEQRKYKWVVTALAKSNVVHEWLEMEIHSDHLLQGVPFGLAKNAFSENTFEVL